MELTFKKLLLCIKDNSINFEEDTFFGNPIDGSLVKLVRKLLDDAIILDDMATIEIKELVNSEICVEYLTDNKIVIYSLYDKENIYKYVKIMDLVNRHL